MSDKTVLTATVRLRDSVASSIATFVRPIGTWYVYSNLNSSGELMQSMEIIRYADGQKVKCRRSMEHSFQELCQEWYEQCVKPRVKRR